MTVSAAFRSSASNSYIRKRSACTGVSDVTVTRALGVQFDGHDRGGGWHREDDGSVQMVSQL